MSDKTQFTAKDFDHTYKTLRDSFSAGKTKSLKWRKCQLKQLYWVLDENEDALLTAMLQDLHRRPLESFSKDNGETMTEILEMVDNLEDWAKGEASPHAGFLFGKIGKAWIRKEPFGLILIIGAWNYPIATLLAVAATAIAAGNAVLLKPSDLASSTQKLLMRRYGTVLTPKFDFIFYTGGSRVGRIIATAAAKHVTPMALELGGQAPGIELILLQSALPMPS